LTVDVDWIGVVVVGFFVESMEMSVWIIEALRWYYFDYFDSVEVIYYADSE